METRPVIEEKWTPAKLWILVVSFGALLFAISGESFWIDEANTALKVVQPDLTSWWRKLVSESGSDMQMPFYMFYAWAFANFFGATEYALRAANLPWLFLGLGALLNASSARKNLRMGIVVATAFSPFVWFYLNEARPYAMQLGASFLLFAALVRLFSHAPLSRSSQKRWSIALAGGIIFLSGSSLLGIIWVGAALVSALAIVGKARLLKLLREFPFLWLATFLILLFLGAYFVWTLKSGARASNAATTGIKNLFFLLYELFGFTGLGPGRIEIRESGLSSFRRHSPALVLYGIVVAAVLLTGWRQRDKIAFRKFFFWPLVWLGAASAFLFVIGYVTHFRVLARHFTPLAVAVLFLISLALVLCWTRSGWRGKWLAGIFLGLSLASCLTLRLASRHKKDDYRAAALIANAELARGKIVWWNADRAGAFYYRVPISSNYVEKGFARWLVNPSEEILLAEPEPDVIVASKPDIYDAAGAVSNFLRDKNFQKATNLNAFTVWQKVIEP